MTVAPLLARLVEQIADAADRRRAAGALTTEESTSLDVAVTLLRARFAPGRDAEVTRAAEEVADVFGLDDGDVGLLVTVSAPDLEMNLGIAMALLDGRAGLRRPSTGLVLELCGLDSLSAEDRRRLAPHGRLRNLGLVRVEGDGPLLTRAVGSPDVVVARLIGDDSASELLRSLTGLAVPTEFEGSKELRRALELGTRLCWIRSPVGAAGAALAAGAFEQAGIECDVVDLARLPAVPGGAAGEGVEEIVRAVLLEAGLRRHGLVLLGADELAPAGGTPRLGVLEFSAVPVLAVGTQPWNPVWSSQIPLTVEAPRLGPDQRGQTWLETIAAADSSATADSLSYDDSWPDLLAMRLTPEEIVRTVREGKLLTDVADRPLDVEALRTAVRRLSITAKPVVPGRTTATLDDLVLPTETLQPVRQIISWARNRDRVLAKGAVNGAGGKGSGISALFAGGPGTGKTRAAHVIAETLGLDLLPIDLSSIVDKYVGETEKNLERVFHEAENLNVVLFFDEADSLFGNRSAVNDSRDRYANLEVSYLLQRMEQFDGIAILATNLRGNLDPAFSRRLQFIVHFADPDTDTRRGLWLKHVTRAGELSTRDPIDADLLAEHLQVSGGDIRNIVMAAAFEATEQGDPVGMTHLLTASSREFEKLGRRLPPAVVSALKPAPKSRAAKK